MGHLKLGPSTLSTKSNSSTSLSLSNVSLIHKFINNSAHYNKLSNNRPILQLTGLLVSFHNKKDVDFSLKNLTLTIDEDSFVGKDRVLDSVVKEVLVPVKEIQLLLKK